MKIIIPLVLLAVLFGCSDKSQEPPESLFKAQKETLDRAKETDDLLKGAEQKRRQQIDQIDQ